MPASTFNWKDYLLQVSLILLSLFIAFGVDRCAQSVKDGKKLATYLEAISEELKEELESTKTNLADSESDIDDMVFANEAFATMEPARLPEAVGRTGMVMARGVFRTFPPMNFELMNSSGDGLLLEDIELRQQLSSIATFRNDYVKADLMRHDQLALEGLANISNYLNIYCLQGKKPEDFGLCITSLEGLRENGVKDLIALRRHSELRAFHLDRYINLLEEVIPEVEAAR